MQPSGSARKVHRSTLNCWDQKAIRTDVVDARELQLRADVTRDDARDDVLESARLVDAPASFR